VGLLATLWNMHIAMYGEFLAARIVQGMGWGTVDALVYASVADLYSVS
jgi:MFS family permease